VPGTRTRRWLTRRQPPRLQRRRGHPRSGDCRVLARRVRAPGGTGDRGGAAGIRAVPMTSPLGDPPQEVSHIDDRWFQADGGRAVADVTGGAMDLVIPPRDVGMGPAVPDRWEFAADRIRSERSAGDSVNSRRLQRDISAPVGDLGSWQGTVKDPTEPMFAEAGQAIAQRRRTAVDRPTVDRRTVVRPAGSGWPQSGGTRTWIDPIPGSHRPANGATTSCRGTLHVPRLEYSRSARHVSVPLDTSKGPLRGRHRN
jgi:hypothetical protein